MSAPPPGSVFRFRCPNCGRAQRANKDVSGRPWRCETCGHEYAIKPETSAPFFTRPPQDRLDDALARSLARRRFVADRFLQEMSLGSLEITAKVTVEWQLETRRWLECRDAAADPWTVEVPSDGAPGRFEHAVPGTAREESCAACRGTGVSLCPGCAGLGRRQCGACAGKGCPSCAGSGVQSCDGCAGRGNLPCAACRGGARQIRKDVLEVGRRSHAVSRSFGPPHPVLTPNPASEIVRLADDAFPSEEAALQAVRARAPECETAVREALDQRPSPSEGRVNRVRVIIEQVPLWRASWTFAKRSGYVWFHGKALEALLPYPPRSPLVFTATVWAGIGVLAVGAFIGLLLLREDLPEEGPLRKKAEPPRPAAAATASLAAPTPLSEDGWLRLADGRILRGALSKDAAGRYRVGDEPSVAPWEIESAHPNARQHLESMHRDCERATQEVAALLASGKPAPRDILVTLLLYAHREREAWIAMRPHLKADEAPVYAGLPDLIERRASDLERALNAPLADAAPAGPSTPPAPGTPAPAPPRPDFAKPFLQWPKPGDAEARRQKRDELSDWAGQDHPKLELILFAIAFLTRDEHAWGLRTDRLTVASAGFESVYEGVLEAQTDTYAVVRTTAGERVSAVRRGTEGWHVNLPGGTAVGGTRCTAEKAAPTPLGAILEESLAAHGPEKWLSLSAKDHLQAARDLLEKSKGYARHPLVQMLAAAHAGAALRSGTAGELAQARKHLQAAGYVASPGGRWSRPLDASIERMGVLIREGRTGEALELAGEASPGQPFIRSYLSGLALILHRLSSSEDLRRAGEALDHAARAAATEVESAHVRALRESLGRTRVCASCGGDATSACTQCRGAGRRRLTCGRCNGHGYIIVVGQGGGTRACTSCGGSPNLGSRDCDRCSGRGIVSCTKCDGPFRIPHPGEVGRLTSCADCRGTGGWGERFFFACPSCRGLGLRFAPAASPEALLR